MKKLFCVLLIFILLLSTGAMSENTPIDYSDGQVHYIFSESTDDATHVTPFVAQAYRFSNPDRIAQLFFGSSEFLIADENSENVAYARDGETLIISKPNMDALLHFDSEYSETVFTPITLITDVYAMRAEIEHWNQELSFMSRAQAEAAVEQFVGSIYEGLHFKSVANFAITRNDYESRYEARKNELEMWFADPKMSEGMRPRVDFEREDLGYLICLAQEVNELPIAWSFFQNGSGLPRNQNVVIWAFWTPEGCKYLSPDYQVMFPVENTAPCNVLSRSQAMEIFSQAYNYVLGAKEIEVCDIQLVWFTDLDGNDDGSRTFRPMWYLYVPKFYGEESEWWGEFGYYVDAVTGETWV